MHNTQAIDMIGKKYGRLTVLEFVETKEEQKGKYVRYYRCKCDCGNEIVVRGSALRNGNTKSCGCYRKEYVTQKNTTHGMTDTRIYRLYRSMVDRCYNPNNKSYADYGGRGIEICKEWKGEGGFENFYIWSMSNGYQEDLSIDRINNDSCYSPDNCRWVDAITQANNKRNSKKYTWNGETHSLPEWGRIKPNGLGYRTLVGRIYSGWSIEDAFGLTKEEAKERQAKAVRGNKFVAGKHWKWHEKGKINVG